MAVKEAGQGKGRRQEGCDLKQTSLILQGAWSMNCTKSWSHVTEGDQPCMPLLVNRVGSGGTGREHSRAVALWATLGGLRASLPRRGQL